MKILHLFAFVSILAIAPVSNAVEEKLEKVTSRGETTKYILTTPEATPVASVILLAGGHGKLSLGTTFGSPTIGWGANNNLVRTREDYAKHGFLVATMDAPNNKNKMNAIWRMSPEHGEDIGAVADALKHKANAPVWVVGTSMGSFSAANAGIVLKDKIAGIVMTSSITRSKPKWKIYDDYPKGVINMPLSEVTVPVLVISHEADKCKLTPAADLDNLASAFSSAAKVDKALFTGGDSPRSDSCKALSAHGFLGIEGQVVEKIADFIKSN